MARVADYSIVTDSWVVEALQDTITFEVPSTVDAGSRSVLGFMLQADHLDDVSLTFRINGTKVWNWNLGGSQNKVAFYQEVIPTGVIKPGTNNFSFDSSSDDYRFVQVSDVVIWWQANI